MSLQRETNTWGLVVDWVERVGGQGGFLGFQFGHPLGNDVIYRKLRDK